MNLLQYFSVKSQSTPQTLSHVQLPLFKLYLHVKLEDQKSKLSKQYYLKIYIINNYDQPSQYLKMRKIFCLLTSSYIPYVTIMCRCCTSLEYDEVLF